MTQVIRHIIPFNMQLPFSIMKIHDIFKYNGYKLYIVGGAVRDAVLLKEPKDFDLATDAIPDVVERILSEAGVKTIATGKSFGVINAFVLDDEFEIATFREESGYTDSRRPDEVRFSTIDKDVMRRDLTINALFYDIDRKEIVDLVGGVQDILRGVIRTVGAPQERFAEDKLRKLRAVRFAARFGSDLDTQTHMALIEDSNLHGVSHERIRDEFLKGIQSARSVRRFMQMLDTYKFFPWIFKDLNINKNFIENRDVSILLAVLLKSNDKKVITKRLSELKYHPELPSVTFLMSLVGISLDSVVALKKLQQNSGVDGDQIRLFSQLEGFDMHWMESFIKFGLSVDGEAVMREYDLKPGKEVGDIIYKLETERFVKLLAA